MNQAVLPHPPLDVPINGRRGFIYSERHNNLIRFLGSASSTPPLRIGIITRFFPFGRPRTDFNARVNHEPIPRLPLLPYPIKSVSQSTAFHL